MQEIIINNWKLVENPQGVTGHWVDGGEIGKHLGYASPSDSVRRLYNRNKESFSEGKDFMRVRLTRADGKSYETRVYSERGALKIVRLSNTEIANKIMDEVIDVFLEVKRKSISIKLLHQEFSAAKKLAMAIGESKDSAILIADKAVKESLGVSPLDALGVDRARFVKKEQYRNTGEGLIKALIELYKDNSENFYHGNIPNVKKPTMGKVIDDVIYVLVAFSRPIIQELGIERSQLRDLAERKLIIGNSRGSGRTCWIDGKSSSCIAVKIPPKPAQQEKHP